MAWTITSDNYAGVTFATAGIAACRLNFNGSGGDAADIWLPGDSDGARPFTEYEDVVIALSGTSVFQGFVTACVAQARGNGEGWAISLMGNLKKLDRLVYQEQIATAGDPPTMVSTSRGVLGYDSDGVRVNTATLIQQVIEYAETPCGITLGTVLSGVNKQAPEMEFQEFTCRECINRVLMWHPDASLYLDHTNNTVKVTRPGAMSTVTKASAGDTSGTVSVQLDSMRRQPVAGVIINWETTSTVDDETWVDVTQDTAGTTTGMDVVVITIPLNGENIITQAQECITETVPEVIGDFTAGQWADFLKKHWPEIAAANPTTGQVSMVSMTQTIDAGTKVGLGSTPSTYPRWLTAGAIPPWQSGISAAKTRLTVTLKPGTSILSNPDMYELFDMGNEKLLELHLDFLGTDAETTTYRNIASFTAAEAPVTGLAGDYYTAMSAAAPSGVITFAGADPDITLMPGKRITLTGDWAVTTGVIQQTTIDCFTGTTTVRFGPNGILTPPDFVQLLRAGGRASPLRNTGGAARISAAPAGREVTGNGGGTLKNTSASKPVKQTGGFQTMQASASTVTVTAGKVYYAKVGTGEVAVTPPPMSLETQPEKVLAYYDIGASTVTVADGDQVWLKIPYRKRDVTVTTIDHPDNDQEVWWDEEDSLVSNLFTIEMQFQSWSPTTGEGYGTIAAEVHPDITPPTADDENGYVLLASITLDGGVMTILDAGIRVVWAPVTVLPRKWMRFEVVNS